MATVLTSKTGLALILALAFAPIPARAFDPDDWRGGTPGDGNYHLTCARPGCSSDTFMTYRLRPPHAVGSKAEYERTIAAAIPELKKRGIEAETSRATRSTLGRFTLYSAKRTLTLPDGHKQYYAAGMLVGDEMSISLFAAAPQADLAARNFEGLADYLAHHPPRERIDH